MSKTPLLQNKQALAVIGVFTTFLLLVIINIWVLAPMLMKVYVPENNTGNLSPIDIETVNKAMDYINGQ